MAKDIHHSSKPPVSPPPFQKRRRIFVPHPQQQEVGGQKGHPGATRTLVGAPGVTRGCWRRSMPVSCRCPMNSGSAVNVVTSLASVLVTGASGFVGRALCDLLARRGDRVVAAVRTPGSATAGAGSECTVGDLANLPDLEPALRSVDCVVHLAARAHVMREQHRDPERAFLRSNALATRHLATQVVSVGVRRLVYLSRIKVNGEATTGTPLRETDVPKPQDAYGRSKLAVERGYGRLRGTWPWRWW